MERLARARELRGRLPGRHGTPAAPPLLGVARADRRSVPHARDRPGGPAVAQGGQGTYLRGRGQHGRPRDAAAARPVPEAAGRCGRLRLGDELLPPVQRLRAQPWWPRRAGAGTRRGRRHTAHESPRVRPPQPHPLASGDRPVGRPAAALVERGRQNRHRPGEAVRSLLPGAAQAASAGPRRGRYRLVEPLLRELREDPASGRNEMARTS